MAADQIHEEGKSDLNGHNRVVPHFPFFQKGKIEVHFRHSDDRCARNLSIIFQTKFDDDLSAGLSSFATEEKCNQ